MRKIEFDRLNFEFGSKPLLIGGRAMEYYGLRKSGNDIDFVITVEDYERLSQKYPDHLKNLGGDLGVCVYEFEIWKTICLFDYAFLSRDAIEKEAYLIVSLEKLLFLKAIAMQEPKYHRDLELIVERVLQIQYETYTGK
jgi:hypothetical protein